MLDNVIGFGLGLTLPVLLLLLALATGNPIVWAVALLFAGIAIGSWLVFILLAKVRWN